MHAHAGLHTDQNSLLNRLECITALRGNSNTGNNLKPHLQMPSKVKLGKVLEKLGGSASQDL